jgi:hypothetical protein
MSKANLAADDDAGERRPGFRAAAGVAARIAGPIVAKHGGGALARLKANWAEIVGPELARAAWPEALARGGTLRLRVAPPKALEIQHRAMLVIERVNLFFGREAVTRLALMQGPLPLPGEPVRAAARLLGAHEADRLAIQLAPVDDTELREALDRLGRAVLGAART